MTNEQGPRDAPPTAITSSDPKDPLALDIRRGTPAVDLGQEVFGRVWGVTPGYCVIRTKSKSFVITPWHDIALGNIRPARTTLPETIDECDKLNSYAQALQELDHARHIGTRPWHQGLPPTLHEAHRFLVRRLKARAE